MWKSSKPPVGMELVMQGNIMVGVRGVLFTRTGSIVLSIKRILLHLSHLDGIFPLHLIFCSLNDNN